MLAIVLPLLALGQPADSMPSVQEVEARALDARRRIKTIQLAMEVQRVKYEGGTVADTTRRRVVTWLSGEQIRSDTVRSWGTYANYRVVECLNCDTPGRGIMVNDKPGMTSLTFRLGEPNAPELRDAIDPRLIGYVPGILATLRNARLDSCVGQADRGQPTVSPARLEGVDCWQLRWTGKNGWAAVVWVCPSQGWNVLRIEVRSPDGKTPPVRLSVASECGQVQLGGIWFPQRVVFESRSGDELREREVITITDTWVNGDIPAAVFTLPGIQLRDGAYLRNRDEPKKSGFWHPDTQTTTRPLPPTFLAGDEAVPVGSQGSVNYWLVALCALCAIGAGAVIFTRRRPARG